MRLVSAVLVGCASAQHPAISSSPGLTKTAVVTPEEEYANAFADFIHRFEKNYTGSEKEARFEAFRSNYDWIKTHNTKGNSYDVGLTRFADLTNHEFSAAYTLPQEQAVEHLMSGFPLLGAQEYSGGPLPDSVDWRNQGAVTTVKNQAQCGSCWSFSTTGAVEGAWKIATDQLISLSEQQLVDCSSSAGNEGCNGGSPYAAMQWLKAKDMCTESSYKYYPKEGSCHSSCSVGIPHGGVSGVIAVRPGDEKALMEAVASQPVAISINGDDRAFQLYNGGVLSGCTSSQINHGVLAVGYGTDNGQDYFTVKNSWGSSWGESGYFRVARGKGTGAMGECGILTSSVYAQVNSNVKLWWYDIPWALLFLGVTACGAVSIAGCCILQKRLRNRRQPSVSGQSLIQTQPQTTARAFAATGGQRLGTAPSAAPQRPSVPPQAAQALAQPQPQASSAGGPAGNSRASRLVAAQQ